MALQVEEFGSEHTVKSVVDESMYMNWLFDI
jgi:hypothetical protein